MKFEILAPAGNQESLIAGVRSGANAVYLGGLLFNARRNAGNFNDEELKKAVQYCRQRGVKVYLTLNILISDDELETAYEAVKSAVEAGVDGFIVQDIGVAKMIKTHFPQVGIHGSTQMSIMTPAGARAAEEMGFSRIVLPREISREEIEEIRNSTDLELELFVHGALCMCVSGQCYLSSVLGSRSGNRGLCAQPCRLPFSPKGDKNEYALSLKDLSLIEHLSELDGIASLKIEGRMKRPEYVSAAVTAVKKAINGELTEQDSFRLNSIFSRSGFTDGYFTGKREDMFGIRRKDDVVAANAVLKEISHGYDNENPLLPIDLSFTCRAGEPAVLKAQAMGKEVTVTGEIPEAAINRPMTAESVAERLKKLGGTQFYPQGVTAQVEDGLILPAAKINELRRSAVQKLENALCEREKIQPIPYHPITPGSKGEVKYLTASFKSANQIPDRHPFKHIFIPPSSSLEDFVDNRAGVALPRGLFGAEEKLTDRLEKLKKAGVTKALCSNIGAYTLARDMGFQVFGDFGLNIFNSESARQIENPILSFELTLNQAQKINADNTGLIVYGRLPLMLTRNCPVKNSIGCKECGGNGRLTDRKGAEFSVICSDYPCVEILNGVPLYMLDRMSEVKADFAHFMFTVESREAVEKIIRLYESGEKPPFEYTRGLYYRGAL